MTITGNTIAANIRVNAQVPFPALTKGLGPIAIDKQNGIWTVALDITDLAPLQIGADPATKQLIVYDQDSGAFLNVAIASLTSFINIVTSGTAIIDFGAFPGAADARITVSGQSQITANSRVECWVQAFSGTADHNVDEHLVYPLRVVPFNIVPGASFDIYATQMDPAFDCAGGQPGVNLTYGKWNIAWRWGN